MKPLLVILTMGGNISKRGGNYDEKQIGPVAQFLFLASALYRMSQWADLARENFSGVQHLTIALKDSDELTSDDVARLRAAIHDCTCMYSGGRAAILIPVGTKRLVDLCAYLRDPTEWAWDSGADSTKALADGLEGRENDPAGESGDPDFYEVRELKYAHASHLKPLPIVVIGTEGEVFAPNSIVVMNEGTAVRAVETALRLFGDKRGLLHCVWERQA